MTTNQITENEHALITPDLIGTDEEKINGLKFYADAIGLLRSLNSSFISFDNKMQVIDALKKELDLIKLEIENVSSVVSQDQDGIPSTRQPTDDTEEIDKKDNRKDVIPSSKLTLTKSKAPTFESLDKLRRVAGSGKWSNAFCPVCKRG